MAREPLGNPKLVQWERIKALYMAGKTAKEISEIEGKTPNAIYLKAWKENWPTPNRIRKNLPPAERGLTPGQQKKQEIIRQNSEIIRHSADVLREKGEIGTSKTVDVLLSLIKKIKPEELEQIADVQTLATAINTLRKATGLDKGEQAVANVNVALFSQGDQPSFRVIDD